MNQIAKVDVGEIRNQNLAARKSNQPVSTSICFGSEKVSYVSDLMEQQQKSIKGMKSNEHGDHMKKLKEMKAELSKASFEFGNSKEKTLYETTSKAALSASSKGHHPVVHIQAKDVGKTTSIYFGDQPTDYCSETQRAGTVVSACRSDFTERQAEVAAMKKGLQKRNFTFGEEPVEYQSDYQRGYTALSPDFYSRNNRSEMKNTLEETRKCHFSLGHDPQADMYTSDSQRAQKLGASQNLSEIKEHQENAKALKQQLQKTSFVIGNDEDFL